MGCTLYRRGEHACHRGGAVAHLPPGRHELQGPLAKSGVERVLVADGPVLAGAIVGLPLPVAVLPV